MGSLMFEMNKFIYSEETGSKVLLDCMDLLKNKSRLPFSGFEGDQTLITVIDKLLEEHAENCDGTDQQEWDLLYILLDVLVAEYHVRSAAPKKVLELGCTNGVMSYHLAYLLGKLHPESLLFSVSNVIGNESGNQWLDRICRVEELPQIAFAAVDYGDTNLKDANFDVTIINGSILMGSEKQIVQEAKRVTAKGGIVICFAIDQPLLEGAFQLVFSQTEKYTLDSAGSILVGRLL